MGLGDFFKKVGKAIKSGAVSVYNNVVKPIGNEIAHDAPVVANRIANDAESVGSFIGDQINKNMDVARNVGTNLVDSVSDNITWIVGGLGAVAALYVVSNMGSSKRSSPLSGGRVSKRIRM